jgi:hypothetical protein
MFPQKQSVTVTTDGSGNATAYTSVVRGQIVNVVYTKNNYADTVDFTVTTEDTLQNVWVESNVTASKTVAPMQATHSTAGVAALYAAGGTAVNAPIYACNERVKIALAQGGATTSGTFTIITA